MTEALYIPADEGTVAGLVKAKLPEGVAEPPLNVDAERGWPRLMALAVGQVETLEPALLTVIFPVPVEVL